MRHSRQRPPAYALILSALLLVLVCVGGCGSVQNVAAGAPQAPTVGVTAGPTARGVTAYSASIQVPENTPGTRVSVSCPAGTQMIGGGYAATSVFEYDAVVASSYPSSANTWTAVAGPGDAFTLQADVYCLAPTFPLGVQVVQTSGAPTSGSGCPIGSVQLGGGFNYPSDYPSGRLYFLCATQHVRVGAVVTAYYNPHSSTHSYYPGSKTLACPSDQIAISGDTIGGDTVLVSDSAGAPYDGWFFTVGGDGDMTLIVRCVSFTA